jgi:CBS-domain-containing membrane protein
LARGDWRSLGVKESDTLETAFNQMMNFGEDVIPVLDSEGRILGDLRLSEVLLQAVEVGEQAMPSTQRPQ